MYAAAIFPRKEFFCPHLQCRQSNQVMVKSDEPKKEFQRQVGAAETEHRLLDSEVKNLDRRLKEEGHTSADDSIALTLQEKRDFVEGMLGSFKTMKKCFKLKDVAIDPTYEAIMSDDLRGEEDLQIVNDMYTRMAEIMERCGKNARAFLAAPDYVYARCIAEYKNWVELNPGKATICVLGSSASGAGALSLLWYAGSGIVGLQLGHHVLLGATLGGVVGLIVLVGLGACYAGSHYFKPDEKPSDVQEVEAMVKQLNTETNNTEYLGQLDMLLEMCIVTENALNALPEGKDFFCIICHAEGNEIISPVRANNCTRHHYMCKACWPEYIMTRDGSQSMGACMACRP